MSYNKRWENSDRKCPGCNYETEELIEEIDGSEYIKAERCQICKWKINFNKEEK